MAYSGAGTQKYIVKIRNPFSFRIKPFRNYERIYLYTIKFLIFYVVFQRTLRLMRNLLFFSMLLKQLKHKFGK